MTLRLTIGFTTLAFLLTSCQSDLKFEGRKWKEERDLEFYPFREQMLNDIIQNKRFVGLSYRTAFDSLGQPENYNMKKDNELWYSVTTEYGTIDPVYTKHLVLTLDKDSTIKKIEVREWKRFE